MRWTRRISCRAHAPAPSAVTRPERPEDDAVAGACGGEALRVKGCHHPIKNVESLITSLGLVLLCQKQDKTEMWRSQEDAFVQ